MSIKSFFSKMKDAAQAGFEFERLYYEERLLELGISPTQAPGSHLRSPMKIVVGIIDNQQEQENFTKLQKKRFEFSRKTAHAGLAGDLLAAIKAASGKIAPQKYGEEIRRIDLEIEKFDIYRKVAYFASYYLKKGEIKQQIKSAQKQKMKA